jgi:predicted GTPase
LPKTQENNLSQVPQDNINLCFVGGVSTGKSTILNAIFSEQLTQCKIKRTTMVPTVYIENPDHWNPFDKADATERIYAEISKKNKEIIDLTERGIAAEYAEMVFNVGKLDINILEDSYVNVYDIPGLNDARTKDVYYKYLDDNFHKFNLMILLVDIQSGLNTSDEMDMLRFVASHVRHHKDAGRKIYTLVVVNKADDMQWNEDTQSLELTGELSEMYEQTENTVKSEFAAKTVQDQLIGILPLCAADAYLYRMVKKHGAGFHLTPDQVLKIGINQMGKQFSKKKPDAQKTEVDKILADKDFVDDMIRLSGFQKFVYMLSRFLHENGTNKQIRIDNILFEIKNLPLFNDVFAQDFNGVVKQYVQMLQKIAKIDKAVFDEWMTSMLHTLKDLLNTAIKTYRGVNTELIVFYQNFKKCVLNAYFTEYDNPNEYNEKGFSDVFVQHIITQIYVKMSNGGYLVDDYLEIFNTLICIGAFNNEIVQTVINTILVNDYPVKFIETSAETDALLQMLTKIKSLDVNLTQFMRHILLERYMTQDEYQTISKYMSYQNRGEIALSTFLAPRSGDRREHITKKIVTWQHDDGLDLLDLFYLGL